MAVSKINIAVKVAEGGEEASGFRDALNLPKPHTAYCISLHNPRTKFGRVSAWTYGAEVAKKGRYKNGF